MPILMEHGHNRVEQLRRRKLQLGQQCNRRACIDACTQFTV